ncbi:MAG: ArnT family glycosyltransferase [Planctomycetota bacterium]|jgi:hypothetical protein
MSSPGQHNTQGGGVLSIDRPQVQTRRAIRRLVLDLCLLFLIALALQTAHFARGNGKTVINADTIQYVHNAESIIGATTLPDFSIRKPGFSLWLAGLATIFDNMTWAVVAANYLLLALVIPAVYGIARLIHSRLAGWIACVVCLAQLNVSHLADRVLSEPLYLFLIAYATLGLLAAIRWRGKSWLWVGIGILLAMAWLVRSVAIIPVMVGLACLVGMYWGDRRKILTLGMITMLPVTAAMLIECYGNYTTHREFRSATGSFGMMLLMRTRHLQGLPMPDSEQARQCLSWIPERNEEHAFRANEVDTWMARYRAVARDGLSDWQVDRIMRQTALQAAVSNPMPFLACSADVFAAYILRSNQVPFLSYVDRQQRLPVVGCDNVEPDSPFTCNWEYWWAYASMPQLDNDSQMALAARIEADSRRRAPFASASSMKTLRYLGMQPIVEETASLIALLTRPLPFLALLVFLFMGTRPQLVACVATLFLLDAVLIACCCPSQPAALRYQSVWYAVDAAMSGSLIAMLMIGLGRAVVVRIHGLSPNWIPASTAWKGAR